MRQDHFIYEIIPPFLLECSPDESLCAIARQMHCYESNAVLIVEKGNPVGTWTESDALSFSFSKSEVSMPVSKVMRRTVVTISSVLAVDAAVILFNKIQENCLLVVDEHNTRLGLLTQQDIASYHLNLVHRPSFWVSETLCPSPVFMQTTSLSEAAERMQYLEVEAGIVLASKALEPSLIGILSRRDFIRALAENNLQCTVGEIATPVKLTLKTDTTLSIARRIMARQGLRFLAVSDRSGRLIGIVRLLDILQEVSQINHRYLKMNWEIEGTLAQNARTLSEIQNLAFYDALTTLPNRRAIEACIASKLATAVKRKKYGALLYIDLDHFKPINDSFGHAVGDRFLIEVAERLLRILREEDVAARYGGDEFLVLLPELSEDKNMAIHAAQTVAEKIERILEMPFRIEGYRLTLGASIGISLFPDQQTEYADVLKEADMAMYCAKISNRKIHFYHRNKKVLALGQSPGDDLFYGDAGRVQRVLLYSPVVDGHKNLRGICASLHWKGLEGQIDSSDFSSAEDETLMRSTGRWKLKEACLRLKSWNESGFPIRLLSLRIGPQLFLQSDIVQQVGLIISECEIDARLIMFELTEETIFNRFDESLKKMKLLHAFGFRFAIDNFACGRSLIGVLSKLPIDRIKMSEQHVQGLDNNMQNTEIVQMIIAIAQNINVQVVAKGVETHAQFEVLKDMGCQFFQGPVAGQPMTASKIPEFIKQMPHSGEK